jgi:hypothetical protein
VIDITGLWEVSMMRVAARAVLVLIAMSGLLLLEQTGANAAQQDHVDEQATSPHCSGYCPDPEGYWLVGSDGGIFSFGDAVFHGSMGGIPLQRPVVGIVQTPTGGGYWLVASDGGVFAFGDAGYYGSIPGLGIHPFGSGLPNSLNAPIVGIVSSFDGHGYFMVASDGGVFAFGDAMFAGSCPGIGGCSGAGVAVVPSLTDVNGATDGYWLMTTTGNVYGFGVPTYGQPGPQSSPITSASITEGPTLELYPYGGYYILDANGQVFAYGAAANGANRLIESVPAGQAGGVNPATAIATAVQGIEDDGNWVATANGSVFPFGGAPNYGGMNGTKLNGSIVAIGGF